MYIIFTTSKHNEREYFLFFLILTVEYEWIIHAKKSSLTFKLLKLWDITSDRLIGKVLKTLKPFFS